MNKVCVSVLKEEKKVYAYSLCKRMSKHNKHTNSRGNSCFVQDKLNTQLRLYMSYSDPGNHFKNKADRQPPT